LSVSAMTGMDFAGRYRVKRRGAVLYFALEGAGQFDNRLYTTAEHHGVIGELPFAIHDSCPPLTDKNAAVIICRWIDEAAEYFKREFGLPIVLIWFDTLITAAGYDAGGDNDTAAAQQVMDTLRAISRHSGAFVIGVDHFGKVIETGTRGSSAKEGAADTVIVLLGDKELSGSIKNTRMALRKQRDGASGFEVPFKVHMKEAGVDEDGDVIIAPPIIEWQAGETISAKADARWTPSMKVLKRVLVSVLDGGKDIQPFPDGPLVRACDIEAVRTEFYKQYPAEGTEEQKAEARSKAFRRSIKNARERELIVTREMDGTQFVWLAKVEDGHDS
jgi:hypothetical protein